MMADKHYHLPLSRRHDKRAKKGGTRHTQDQTHTGPDTHSRIGRIIQYEPCDSVFCEAVTLHDQLVALGV